MGINSDVLAKMQEMACQLSRMNHEPRSIGGAILYASEIHTIKAIKEYENVNITCLASKMEVTKGAISKIVNKLVTKGFVTKFKEKENRKEVHLQLTESGELVYEDYRDFKKKLDEKFLNYFGKMEEEQKRNLIDMMDRIELIIKEHIEK